MCDDNKLWYLIALKRHINKGGRIGGQGDIAPHFLRFVNWEDKPTTVLTWAHKHAISLIYVNIKAYNNFNTHK